MIRSCPSCKEDLDKENLNENIKNLFYWKCNKCGWIDKISFYEIIEKIMLAQLDCYETRDFPDAVWLYNPALYKYVRAGGSKRYDNGKGIVEHFERINKENGREKIRLIGYYESWDSYYYLFWLKEYDCGMPEERSDYGYGNPYKFKGYPSEAIRIVDYNNISQHIKENRSIIKEITLP